MASSTAGLSRLQGAVLEGIGGGAGFYLTGGAALSAFYLHHRQSLDLDLFVVDPAELETLERRLEGLCAERGWSIETVQRYPGFRRFIVRDGLDETMIDIVHEPVAQIVPLEEKPIHGGLHVDALADLVANKLCALLGRGDVKDLIDLYVLDRVGVDIAAHVGAAQAKDGGLDPSTLSFVLGSMPTDPSRLLLVDSIAAEDVAAFRDRLVDQLLSMAWPQPPSSTG